MSILVKDTTYNETELLKHIANGNEDAMRVLFTVYYPRLCFFAESLINNREESRDIAQEALMQLWNQRARFSDQKEENLAAYLFTVARRDCYDYLKHQRVKQTKQKDITARVQTFEEGTEADIIYLETLNKIYEEIKNLPSHLAEIVSLSSIEGLTTDEIAKRLQISTNNVRVQKSRALEKLKTAVIQRNLSLTSSSLIFFLKFFVRTVMN